MTKLAQLPNMPPQPGGPAYQHIDRNLTEIIERSVAPYMPALYTFLMMFGLPLPYMRYPMPFGMLTEEEARQTYGLNRAFMRILQNVRPEVNLKTRMQMVLGLMQAFGANVDDPKVQQGAARIAQTYGRILDTLGIFMPSQISSLHGLKGTTQGVVLNMLPYLRRFYPNMGDIDDATAQRLARTSELLVEMAPLYGFTGEQLAQLAGILHSRGIASIEETDRLRELLPKYAKVFAAARFAVSEMTGKKNIVQPAKLLEIVEKAPGWESNPDAAVKQIMGMAALSKGISTEDSVIREAITKAKKEHEPWAREILERAGDAGITAKEVSQVVRSMEQEGPTSFEGKFLGALLDMKDRGRITSNTARAALDAVSRGEMTFIDPATKKVMNVASVISPERVKYYLSGNEIDEAIILARQSKVAPGLRKYPHLVKYVPLMKGDQFRRMAEIASGLVGGGMGYAALNRLAQQHGFPDVQTAVLFSSPDTFRAAYAKELAKHVQQYQRYARSLQGIRSPSMTATFLDTLRMMGEKAMEPGQTEGPFGVWGTAREFISPMYPEAPQPSDVPEPRLSE